MFSLSSLESFFWNLSVSLWYLTCSCTVQLHFVLLLLTLEKSSLLPALRSNSTSTLSQTFITVALRVNKTPSVDISSVIFYVHCKWIHKYFSCFCLFLCSQWSGRLLGFVLLKCSTVFISALVRMSGPLWGLCHFSTVQLFYF